MQRLNIFISSAMLELHDERILLKNDFKVHQDIDTFVFEADAGARPESIQRAYLDEVAAADLYIGIFWNHYGEATIEEFRHAKALGKPCFIYVKDFQVSRDKRLEVFLNEIADLRTGVVYRRFNNILDLIGFARKDVQNWLVREWRQSNEKRKVSDITAFRLQQDAIHVVNLCQQTDTIKVLESKGSPPTTYLIEYSMNGIIGIDADERPMIGNRHIVEFDLDAKHYPFNLPHTKFITPIFHPNIYQPEGVVCMGWHQLPYHLSDVCIHIARMIDYQVFHCGEGSPFPSNHKAARWARKNLDIFPLTEWAPPKGDWGQFS